MVQLASVKAKFTCLFAEQKFLQKTQELCAIFSNIPLA